jgi:hypothetical protein
MPGDHSEHSELESLTLGRNLREQIIKDHYTGNAEGSTLRKTLGCLLADELGIQLRRVGSGKGMTFT